MSEDGQPNSGGSGYHKAAGGLDALISGVRHTLKERNTMRSVRTLLRVNQPDGFDCPGCAWPEPKDASRLEFCENGIKAVTFEATSKRVGPEFFARHTVSFLNEQTDHFLEAQGRLTHPMRYSAATDHYEPVTWEDAFALIGDKLRALDHPDQAVFYTSGRTSNEAAFLYQLFARLYGTNNMPDCSNMCHESSGVALGESIGVGKGTVTLEDFDHADAIFILGQNPGTNHPRMLAELQKAGRRGAKVVTFNPLREAGLVAFSHPKSAREMLLSGGTPISTHYYPVLIGGDLAALTGIAKHLLEAEQGAPGTILDDAFIREHTSGFEAFAAHVRGAAWEVIEAQSGLSREQLQEAAEVYAHADRAIFCWAMGLTQHKHAAATIQMIVNLLLMRGQFGKPGAGACPVRGHSNVQGDRTVGITEKPRPEFLRSLGEVFGFEPPTGHGLDTIGAIHAMARGQAKVFIGMGGNFAAASPDTDYTIAALRHCELTIHVSTKLNRSHVVPGREALILPCLGRTERDVQATGPQRVTVEDSMSMVHASMGRNPPASEHLRSEPSIIAGIAKATLNGDVSNVDFDHLVADYARIREKIAQTLPDLFHDYNRRIDQPGGFYLGNSARSLEWKTANQTACFTCHDIPDLMLPPGQLRLMTIRSHDQFNTTVYDVHDRYRGVYGERRIIFMNPADLADRGLQDGDRVDITSHFQDGVGRVVKGFRAIAYDIPRGCAAGYFPEMNPLVTSNQWADKSRTPLSKFIPATVRWSADETT